MPMHDFLIYEETIRAKGYTTGLTCQAGILNGKVVEAVGEPEKLNGRRSRRAVRHVLPEGLLPRV